MGEIKIGILNEKGEIIKVNHKNISKLPKAWQIAIKALKQLPEQYLKQLK